ncbi:glycosyltransferase [Candidatus Pelagibacter sp.]|nr:glycosyltransferase [Candidatus Pelagibacter sp.]
MKSKKTVYSNKKGYNTIFLFASSCENFSVSLIEGMSKGFPILCVDLQPMKSVLGNTALFYKHNSYKDFNDQFLKILSSHKKRLLISNKAHIRVKKI